MSAYLYLLLAMVSSSLISIVMKMFPVRGGNRYALVLGNYLVCVVIGFLLLPEKEAVLQPLPMTLLMGIIGGILYVGGFVTQQVSIGINGAILSSAFARLGLLVTIAVSIGFFHERPGILQAIGLVLVILAVIVINGGKRDAESTQELHPLLLVIVLLCSGMAEAMSKIFERLGERSQDSLFVLGVFFFAGVVTALLMLLDLGKGKKVAAKDFLAGMLIGVPNYFTSALLLKALVGLPAILVYPMFSTGVIVLVTLVSAVVFHERPGKRGWIGLAMILCAVVLLNV